MSTVTKNVTKKILDRRKLSDLVKIKAPEDIPSLGFIKFELKYCDERKWFKLTRNNTRYARRFLFSKLPKSTRGTKHSWTPMHITSIKWERVLLCNDLVEDIILEVSCYKYAGTRDSCTQQNTSEFNSCHFSNRVWLIITMFISTNA